MRLRCLILIFLFSLGAEQSLYAQPRHLYRSAAVPGMHLPVWSAKDLRLFQKYGLNVGRHLMADPEGYFLDMSE